MSLLSKLATSTAKPFFFYGGRNNNTSATLAITSGMQAFQPHAALCQQQQCRLLSTTGPLASSRHPLASMLLYDPFRPLWNRPSGVNGGLSPFWGRGPTDPFFDAFFDDNYKIQVRDNAAQLRYSDDGDITYTVDTTGYRSEELNVEMEGDDICVRGDHKESREGETVHRQFVRRVRIPSEGYDRDAIKCELDADGRLRLCVRRLQSKDGVQKRSIPIDYTTASIGGGTDAGADGGDKQSPSKK